MVKVTVRQVGDIKEVLLGHDGQGIEVIVEGDELKIVDHGTVATVAHIPAPILWVKDKFGEPIEFPEDEPLPTKFDLPFYEVAINPLMRLLDVSRFCRAFGGGLDGIRGHMMDLAKVQLIAEENKADAVAMAGMDWGIRVYRTFCLVLPADDQGHGEEVEESDGEVHIVQEALPPCIGCVAYHNVGMIAGKNIGVKGNDEGVSEQEVS